MPTRRRAFRAECILRPATACLALGLSWCLPCGEIRAQAGAPSAAQSGAQSSAQSSAESSAESSAQDAMALPDSAAMPDTMALPDRMDLPRLGVAAWVGWGNPGGDLLEILAPGAVLAVGLQARLGDAVYLKGEHLRTGPEIDDLARVQETTDSIRYNHDYGYWDLCLLAGLDLGRARVGRPHLFVEAGGGLGCETFTFTTTDLEGGAVLDRSPDRYFFVLALGAGIGVPVHPRLRLTAEVAVRTHWDTDPGTGLFDVNSGTFYPPEEFEPTLTRNGTITAGRLGAVWTIF